MRRRFWRWIRQGFEDVADALLPGACRQCGAALPQPARAAPREARPYSALYSGALRRAVAGPLDLSLALLCPRCCDGLRRARAATLLQGSPAIECVAAFEPAPALFEIVHALKYEAAVELAPWLGAFLAASLRRALADAAGAALVPVPLHRDRLRERGYNQSALLAREVQRRLGLPLCDALLARTRATRPQAQLAPEERAENVAGAFARIGPLPQGSGRLLLVDDVVTSGSTARAALDALGCEPSRVLLVALCRAHSAPPHPSASG